MSRRITAAPPLLLGAPFLRAAAAALSSSARPSSDPGWPRAASERLPSVARNRLAKRQAQPLQRQRVDGDEDARAGHRDCGDLGAQHEAPWLEDAGGDRQRER